MRHFKPEEFTDYSKMDSKFLSLVDELRDRVGIGFNVLSDYRLGEGHHSLGRAMDFWMSSSFSFLQQFLILVRTLSEIGRPFRLGIYLWGAHKPFFHLDNCDIDGGELTTSGKKPVKYWVCVTKDNYEWKSTADEAVKRLMEVS